jgi:predicted Zn-dependent protease
MLLALALLAGAVAGLRAAPARPAPPTREQVARWVRQLGDNDFAAREEASKKLWEAGEAAEPALREAAGSEDAEVSRRARELINKFKWGIYPDTPARIVELITAYQGATDPAVKANLIGDLFKAGAPGTKALLKIAAAEPDVAVRRQLFQQISGQMRNALPQLLAENNFGALEALLELTLAGDVKGGVSHYAAYWLLRGRLDDRIAHYKALAARGPDAKRAAEILVYLYRARGDLKAARQAAAKAGRADLVEAFLYEAGAWKELARLPDLTGTTNEIEKDALRAAYHRLAGNRQEFEDALAVLRKHAEGAAGGERPLFFAGAKAFLLNDRPDEGLKLLARGGEQKVLFEILVARLQFGPALELVDKARTANSPELPVLEILKARTLHSLGEKDKALPIFTRYAGQIKEGVEVSWYEDLIDAEYRAGLTDQAFEHAARVLAVSKDPGWVPRLFPRLFPERGETAEALWPVVLQRNAAGGTAAAVRELRNLLDGKAGAGEVAGLIAAVERQTKAGDTLNAALRLRAVAEAAHACGQEVQARACLEKAGALKAETPEVRAAAADALVRLGDLLADTKEWGRAAQRYRQAGEKDPSQPLPLFLSGWALVKAGREKEGRQRMEQSHWLPLGDPYVRDSFGRALGLRGHTAAARRENELLLRLSEPASFYTGEGMRRAAAAALARKDYLRAALGQEQSMLRCLRPYVNFIQPAAYVGVPAFVHRLRATGLVAAGRLDEAWGELTLSQALLPGGVDLPLLLVPELERRGRKKEAAELFDRTLKVYEKLCQDYPRCAWAHNSAAWLSACCRRNLDQALDHATRAVALAPANAGHLDTLAEVYFQRGERDKALAAQRKVVQMDPKKPYFRQQLKRIEAGNPAADRPAEEDD